MQTITDPHGIILFDGICNLCNRAVNFIIRKDRRDHFRFASLQSEVGQQFLKQFHIPPSYDGSIVLIEEGRAWQKSDAFCHIMKSLPGAWKIFYGGKVLPRFLRDGLYNFIARHRYRWFGERNTCRVPAPDEREKFLNADMPDP